MNSLYPIFLKTENLNILVVGGGNVASEKLHFILKNSPKANITIVAETINDKVQSILQLPNISISSFCRKFEVTDLDQKHLVIAATNDRALHQEMYALCRTKNLLINVADTPELCDFYLGSIVTKGDLKIAISTNGKSPTLAKRLREFFEAILPDEIEELSDNLHQYRNSIQYDLKEKIKKLNELTRSFLDKK